MKLSTLYEARNPKFEKELEPTLVAPFRTYHKRQSEANKIAKQHYNDYGLPDRQFLPNPESQTNPEQGAFDSWLYRHQPTTPTKHDNKSVPVLGYSPIRALNNKADTTTLNKAIAYWHKSFDGKRWPTLEQAFLNRDWTFKGGMGTYNTARTSLFKYLNNLKEPWPEGEKMANGLLASGRNALRYVALSPDIRQYVASKPERNKGLVDSVTTTLAQYDKEMADWQIKHDAWTAAKKPSGDFHDDDEFGSDHEPQPPDFWYGDEKWARNYIK